MKVSTSPPRPERPSPPDELPLFACGVCDLAVSTIYGFPGVCAACLSVLRATNTTITDQAERSQLRLQAAIEALQAVEERSDEATMARWEAYATAQADPAKASRAATTRRKALETAWVDPLADLIRADAEFQSAQAVYDAAYKADAALINSLATYVIRYRDQSGSEKQRPPDAPRESMIEWIADLDQRIADRLAREAMQSEDTKG